jgi:hypothetical protein
MYRAEQARSFGAPLRCTLPARPPHRPPEATRFVDDARLLAGLDHSEPAPRLRRERGGRSPRSPPVRRCRGTPAGRVSCRSGAWIPCRAAFAIRRTGRSRAREPARQQAVVPRRIGRRGRDTSVERPTGPSVRISHRSRRPHDTASRDGLPCRRTSERSLVKPRRPTRLRTMLATMVESPGPSAGGIAASAPKCDSSVRWPGTTTRRPTELMKAAREAVGPASSRRGRHASRVSFLRPWRSSSLVGGGSGRATVRDPCAKRQRVDAVRRHAALARPHGHVPGCTRRRARSQSRYGRSVGGDERRNWWAACRPRQRR